MKRLGILLGLSVLAGAGGGLAYAETQAAGQEAQVYADVSQEQVVAMVEKLGLLIDGAQITRVESAAEPYDSWKISFSTQAGQWNGNPLYYGYIELAKSDGTIVAVDVRKGTGRVWESSFDISQEKVDKEKAKALVQDFINDNPWLSGLTLIYSPYPLSAYETRHEDRSVHRVRFDYALSGLRYNDQSLGLWAYVDRRTGEIAGYQASWRKLALPDPVQVVPIETVAMKVFEDAKPELVYTYANPMGTLPLLWRLDLRNRTIDAVTGEWVSQLAPLTDGWKPIAKPPAQPVLTNAGLSEEQYMNVSEPAIDWATARLNAAYYLQQKVPGYINQLVESSLSLNFPAIGMPKAYQFRFERHADGIPLLSSQYVDLHVDAVTGELRNFSSNLIDWEYPAAVEPAVHPERAKRLLLSLYDIELQYEGGGDSEPQLFYSVKLKPDAPMFYTGLPPFLDAQRPGTWWDYTAEPVTEPIPAASDWLKAIVASTERIAYSVAVALDGKLMPLSKDPVIRQDTTLMPFRDLLEALGASVNWDDKSRKVTAQTGAVRIELAIGSDTATVNGQPYSLSAPAQIIDDSTYVPVRFIAEALGAEVHWEGASRLVHIVTNPPAAAGLTEAELRELRHEAQQRWEEKHWQP